MNQPEPREIPVDEIFFDDKKPGRQNVAKQIAQLLGATERTIKAHRHRVMEKMGVQSLAELVSVAERLGVLRGLAGEG